MQCLAQRSGWDLRVRISYKLPGGAAADGPWATLISKASGLTSSYCTYSCRARSLPCSLQHGMRVNASWFRAHIPMGQGLHLFGVKIIATIY